MTARRPDLSGRPAQRRKAQLIADRPPICIVCSGFIDTTLDGNHPDGPTTEHLIPVSAGGHPTDPSNLALSHRRCNIRRGNKPLSDARPAPTITTSRDWT